MEKDTRYDLLDKVSISADQISRPSVSYWKDAWRRFRKDKLAMFGLVMIIIVSLFAIFGPMFCPYEYDEADFLSIAQWPSKAHWFGTDALGRDLYVRVLYGARISLSIGVVAALPQGQASRVRPGDDRHRDALRHLRADVLPV